MKNPKNLAFTMLESIFIIAAIVVIAMILAGLYLKSAKLPSPGESKGAKSPVVEPQDGSAEPER